VTVTVGAVDADGTTSTITVTARDQFGNPVSGAAVSLVATGSGNTLTQPGVTNASGVATGTLSSTDVGDKVVTATAGGTTITQEPTVTVEPGAASTATSTITAIPISIAADGVSTSTITVQLVDANGNNLTQGGDTVTLSTTLGTLSSPVNDNGDGTYTATLTSVITVGTATITGIVNGAGIVDTATVDFT
jgi:adhesin/invasin